MKPVLVVALAAGLALGPAAVPDDVAFVAIPGAKFSLSETEITVAQFRRFVAATGYVTDAERGEPMGEHGRGSFASTPRGDRDWSAEASWRKPFPLLPEIVPREDLPVVHVSWNDARAFCAHYGWRLPSEAEWELAARAGSETTYPWGEAPEGGHGMVNVADASAMKRFPSARNLVFLFDDGFPLIAPAGRLAPNAWGLRDMIGNVEEWCEDVFAKGDDAKDPKSARVLRGGSFLDGPERSRATTRAGFLPAARRDFVGFRAAR